MATINTSPRSRRLTVALLNGNIAMVGASGEFFSNHALRLKQRARVKQLFFFGYSNGYHQYFPTIEAAHGGAVERQHCNGRRIGRVLQQPCTPAEAASQSQTAFLLRLFEWLPSILPHD